ncbi:MAG: hypothetical protein WBV22_06220 [Anaerolineaceae bacterium]
MPRIIGDIRKDDIATLYQRVKEYRSERFNKNGNGVQRCESISFMFGGCGGNPDEIIRLARENI